MNKEEETLELLREQKIRDQNNRDYANQIKRVGGTTAVVGFWAWIILSGLGGEYISLAPLGVILIPIGLVIFFAGWLKDK